MAPAVFLCALLGLGASEGIPMDSSDDGVVLLQTRAAVTKIARAVADAGSSSTFSWGPPASLIEALGATLIGGIPAAANHPAPAIAFAGISAAAPAKSGLISGDTEKLLHIGEDCFGACNHRLGGYCSWCGVGNACCRSGWAANSSSECVGVTAFKGRKHECVTPVQPTYIRKAGHRCGAGAGGRGNDLDITCSPEQAHSVNRKTALEICGPACDHNDECGGFFFAESLGKCFFKTSMPAKIDEEDTNHDCYVRVQSWMPSSFSQTASSTSEKVFADKESAEIGREKGEVSHLNSLLETDTAELLDTLTRISRVQEALASKTKQVNAKILAFDHQVAASSLLTEDGYQAVANMKSSMAMNLYIRRIVDELACSVSDEGGLEGFVPHYSGEVDTKTYAKLEHELNDVCRLPDGWLRPH